MSMIRLFSWALLVVVGLSMSTATLAYAADDAKSSIGINNCSTIDVNWKPYGESINGANIKVSDVVLNACEALGGRELCNFISGCRYRTVQFVEGMTIPSGGKKVVRNGKTYIPLDAEAAARQQRGCTPNITGASQSQHLHDRAIDVTVPKGREAEFITLAICGLRKVNNCQGGIGYYSGGSIHVDVRTSTGIWGDDYSRESVEDIHNVAVRTTLYGFGSGKCVTGSIQSDETEREIYGPTEEYTPPKGFEDFGPLIIRSQTEQEALLEALRAQSVAQYNNPYYGFLTALGGAFTPSFTGSQQQGGIPTTGGPLTYPSGQGGTTGTSGGSSSGSFLDNLFGGGTSATGEEVPGGASLTYNPDTTQGEVKATCEGSGLFGISLFSTCKNQVADTQTHAANSTGSGTIQSNVSPGTASGPQTNNAYAVYDATSGGLMTGVTSGNAIGVSYNFHQPSGVSNGNQQQSSGFDNYGQFVAGQVETVAPRESDALRSSLRLAENSVTYGSYYGLMHGLSPLVIGSMPRTLWRIGKESAARVHNPFSI